MRVRTATGNDIDAVLEIWSAARSDGRIVGTLIAARGIKKDRRGPKAPAAEGGEMLH